MTAKLRRLKSGDKEEGAGVKTIKTGVKNITDKLKNLKGGDEPPVPGNVGEKKAAEAAGAGAPASQVADAAGDAGGEQKAVTATALKSAASRLKALAEKKAGAASAPAPEQVAGGDAGAAATKKAALGSSASRLAASRSTRRGAAATSPITDPASWSATRSSI